MTVPTEAARRRYKTVTMSRMLLHWSCVRRKIYLRIHASLSRVKIVTTIRIRNIAPHTSIRLQITRQMFENEAVALSIQAIGSQGTVQCTCARHTPHMVAFQHRCRYSLETVHLWPYRCTDIYSSTNCRRMIQHEAPKPVPMI